VILVAFLIFRPQGLAVARRRRPAATDETPVSPSAFPEARA
jgi:hypothetical protein